MKIKGGIFALSIIMLGFFGVFNAAFAVGTVSGTITNLADGSPVTSMYIYVENSETGDLEYGYTDGTGFYSASVAAGNYFVYNLYYSSDDDNNYYIRSETSVFTVNDGDVLTKDLSLTRRGRIAGYIYEADGTTPIYDANISASKAGYSSIYGSDSTAISGYYLVIPQSSYPDYDYTLSSEGNYNVTASATNFFPKQTTTSITNENTTSLNISLNPASVISGTVTDVDGHTITDASISIVGNMSGYYYGSSTTSAADGSYTFHAYSSSFYDGNAVGTYTVTFNKTGYVTQSKSVSITTANENITDNDVVLVEGGTITGTIYKDDGTTIISGATISANDGFGNTYTATSAADGTYTLSGLRASTNYTLTISKTGYVTSSYYNISVVAGEIVSDQNFNLDSSVTFSGTIKDKNGNAIESAYVYIYKRGKARSTSADYSVLTSSDGVFTISNIVPGSYRLKIVKEGYISYKKEKVNLKTDKADTTYKLTSASVIYGRITNSNKPVKSATIYVYAVKKDGDSFVSTTTDNNGYYRISNLPKGSYKIRVITTDYAEKIVTKKIKAGIKKQINIKVATAGSISGHITDKETGLPLSGYAVKVNEYSNSTYSDANGYYILDGLSPGKYNLFVLSSWYEKATEKKIQVDSGKITENINFELTLK